MKKSTYIIITILLAVTILPVLWSAARGSLLKVSAPAAKGLVGQWALDNVTGAKDKTPNGNNGTGAGGVTIGGATDQHGQASRATTFDGTDDKITVADTDILDLTGNFTISCWVKRNGIDVADSLVSKHSASGGIQGGWTTFINSDNKFYLQASSGDWGPGPRWQVASNTTYSTAGVWLHIAVTLSGTSATMYVNGNADGVATATGNTQATIKNMVIGGNADNGSAEFPGSIADVRVYNRALSATEVTSLYNSYRPVRQISSLYKGLVLDMPLAQADLKSSTTIADKTPYSQTGTLVASPTFTTDRKGQSNKAMSFNGTTQAITLGPIMNFTGDMSVALWVKKDGTDNGWTIAKRNPPDNQWQFWGRLDSTDQKAHFWNGTTVVDSNTNISNNVWHHVAVTRSGTTITFYLDGVADGTQTLAVPSSSSANVFIQSDNSAPSYANGSIHSVKVWNRALSAVEITQLYNSY